MNRSSYLVAGILLASVGIASAADMPLKARPMVTPNWAGWYIGANVGGAWSNSTATWNPLPSSIAFGSFPISGDNGGSAFIGGIHGGYNWQLAPAWVAGIEADISWSDAGGSLAQKWLLNPGGAVNPTTNTGMSQTLNWISSARARLGYLVTPNVLMYATGGVAWANFDYSGSAINTANGYSAISNFSSTRTGYTLGAGLEWALNNSWMLRGEYLYYRFDGASATANSTVFPAFPSNYVWSDTDVSVVRAGLSYKF